MQTLSVKILQRTDTEANWNTNNPILSKNEHAYIKGTGNFKIGDGETKWSDLPLYESLTSNDRSKIDSIESGANKTTVDSALSSTSTNPVQNKVVNSALAGKSNTNHAHDLNTMINTLTLGTSDPTDDDYYISQYAGGGTTTTTYHRRPVKALLNYIKSKLSKVATTGSYNDLSDKPTIPSVGNGTITIKQAGTSKGTFTMNQSGNTTIELTDNNTWRGVQNVLTSTATDQSLSAAQGKWLNENKATITTLTSENLNSVKTPGFYNAGGGNTVTNKPSGVEHFGLIVVKRADGNYYIQIIYSDATSYRRYCINNTWGDWKEEKITDTIYTHPSYTSKTSGLYKFSVDGTGHVSGTTAVSKADITALGIPSTNTTYSTGTSTVSGLTKLYPNTGTNTDGTMTQAALKTALDGKTNTGHTHNYAGSSSAGGSATSANKLTTARSISLNTGASGAVSFDGSKDVAIPVTSVKESYLSWGGKNYSGSFGCIDAAMIPDLGANRLAFGSGDGITIEYSRDSGSTWTDYGLSTAQRSSILSTGLDAGIGKCDSTNKATATYMLRVTLDTDKIPVYTVLNKFVFYVNTNGSNGCYCTIEASLESTPTTWKTFANKVSIAGWSGWNVINTSEITTYGNNASSQYGLIRFTFGCTSSSTTHTGLKINKILAFGGQGWTTPSTMARNGHLYGYDIYKNASFPASVSATTFTENGTTLSSKYAALSHTHTKSQITDFPATLKNPNAINIKGAGTTVSSYDGSAVKNLDIVAGTNVTITPDATNGKITIASKDTNTTYSVATSSSNGLMSSTDKVKLDGIASGANKYTHPSYTSKSSGLYKVTVDSTGHISATTAVTKSDITALGIPASDTNTWTALKGATTSTSGTAGYVPAPSAGAANRYLRSDGTWAVPENTDTKVTNMLETKTKAYLTATSSASTNTGTQVFDTGVYLTNTAGGLHSEKFEIGNATLSYDSSNKMITISFS